MSDQIQLSCVLCGCRNPHITTPSKFLPSHKKAEDIIQINKEVVCIEQQIEFLRVKRASLLHQLNVIQSITYTIPSEILSYIMQIAARMKPLKERYSETFKKKFSLYPSLAFSAVSSHWRHVAHSSPHVWTSLRLVPRTHVDSASFMKNKVLLLGYYFERAKSLPLSLGFYDFDYGFQGIKPFLDITLGNNPTSSDAGNQTICSQLQDLEVVSGGDLYTRGRDPKCSLPMLPVLQRLTIQHNLIFGTLSGTKITYLNLHQVPADYCIRLLLDCMETIVELYFTHQCEYDVDWEPPVEVIIHTIPRLQILHWDFATPTQDHRYHTYHNTLILQRLNLPSLRQFSTSALSKHHLRLGKSMLLTTTSTPFSMVHVASASWMRYSSPKQSFAQLLDIETSTLSIDTFDMDLLNILHVLTPSLEPESKVLIPGLKELRIIGKWSMPIGILRSQVFPAIIQMVEERSISAEEEVLQKPFVLAVPKNFFVECEGELRRVIDNGMLRLTTYDHDNMYREVERWSSTVFRCVRY